MSDLEGTTRPQIDIPQIDIDPDGDVVLVLADRLLLVSSKVLSVASRTFKTMFSRNFSEHSARSTADPGPIPLPADDGEAMEALCNVLHFRFAHVTKTPTPDFLDNLAIAADKWECVGALAAWTATALERLAGRMGLAMTDARLLFPAYALGLHDHVRLLTYHMVYAGLAKPDGDGLAYGIPLRIQERLPVEFLPLLICTEREIKQKLQVALEDLVSPLLRKIDEVYDVRQAPPAADSVSHSSAYFSGCNATRVSLFFKALMTNGLWPMTTAFDTMSIVVICDALKRCSFDITSPQRVASCQTCQLDLGRGVRSACIDALDAWDGLSLSCVRNNLTDVDEVCDGFCRIE
jgi:hypothetical protein